jgi:chromosome segregation ATPase
MISEHERLSDKLSTVELTRDDIHKRLREAENLSQQLKEEKKAKTKEIHALRTAGAIPLVEASEHQRRTISKSLKRVEEEKAFFRSMMAQMMRDEVSSVRGLDNPQQYKYGHNSFGEPTNGMKMDSSVLINTTEAMLRNLEQDMMSAQSSFRSREDGSVMSNPNPWGAAERPAGWLGDAIRSRSSSN